MNEEARKLHLLSVLLSEKDKKIWDEIESLLITKQMKPAEQSSFKDFAGILTHNEAAEMKRVIKESCEQIDPNEWR